MPEPFIKFYPNDWTSDPELNRCALGARELWKRMLILMRVAEPFGFFVGRNGEPIDVHWFAREVQANVAEVRKHMRQLDAEGVFSRDSSGRIYSRRMVRAKARQEQAVTNGRHGGNPALIPDKQSGYPTSVNQSGYPDGLRPIARDQKLESRSSDSLRSSAVEFGQWPVENERLRQLALLFLGAFGNCFDPAKAEKHLPAYMGVLAQMRSRGISIADAWQACTDARDANNDKPLWSTAIRTAMSFMPSAPGRRSASSGPSFEDMMVGKVVS